MMLKFVTGLQMLLMLTQLHFKTNHIEEMKNDTIANKESTEVPKTDLVLMMRRYAAYNHWADQELANWLRNASEEDLNREIESSFSSLQETVIHIWNAEYLWLQTVKGESSDNSPAKNFEGTKEELLEGWMEASENFSEYVNTMSLEQLQEKRPRSNGQGSLEIADMIQHCMNHSTYHRGQLITMGRQAGLQDPPRTDFIYFVSLNNK
jgi:uncharacterized damage-inducible protein DinB